MLKITAEEYLHESGFQHSAFTFAQEANMHENKYNHYRIPAGLLIVFLEKALTLIHMETHLNDNEEIKMCSLPFTLLSPHYCDSSVASKERVLTELESLLEMDQQINPTTPSKACSSIILRNLEMDLSMSINEPVRGGTNRQNGDLSHQLSTGLSRKAFHSDILESNGKSILVMNQHEGDVLYQWPNSSSQVFFTQWNPCKRLLVSGGHDKQAHLWNAQGESLATASKIKSMPHVKEMAPGPQSLFNYGGQLQPNNINSLDTDITSVNWNHTGDKVLTSASDGLARIWNDKGELINVLKSNNMLLASKWNRDSSLVASGGQDRIVQVWLPKENRQQKLIRSFNQESAIVDLDWQNQTDLASSCIDNNICLWSLAQDQPLRIWKGHQSPINMIKWDPAGALLASCSEDDVALLWSPNQNQHLIALKGHDAGINALKWSNYQVNSHQSLKAPPILATASRDKTIKIWDVEQGKCIMTLSGHEQINLCRSSVQSLSFSPDNQMLTSGGFQDEMLIWSLREQKLVRAYESPQKSGGVVFDVNWSHDGVMLAAGNNKAVVLFDIRNIQPIQM